MTTQLHGTWALLAAAALLAACESTPITDPAKSVAPVESRSVPSTAGAGTSPSSGSAGGVSQSQVASVDLSKNAAANSASAAALGQRVVYFDFDSFTVRDEFRPMLDAHAKALATQRGKRLVIEGHTDERGSREYNLALGQKRAEAVLRSLALLGVPDAQLEAVSFGEERAADQGHDDAAWAKNRRAELKDR